MRYNLALVSARCLFVCTTLLLFANAAHGDGTYQRTKDGKTLVWNNYPEPGDAATWSGDRDTDGYGSGSGILTWYARHRLIVTGSNIPTDRYTVIGRYSGKMVRGKLAGPVATVDAHGRTFHCTFVDGKRASRWAAGLAPTSAPEPAEPARQEQIEPASQDVAVVETEPSAPAEGAPVAQRSRSKKSEVSGRAGKETPNPETDDSVWSLVGPPPLLRTNTTAESPASRSGGTTASQEAPPQAPISPPQVRPVLAEAEVIELANAEARTQKYDLGQYQRPNARYATENNTWSVEYDPKSIDANGMVENRKPLSVTVEDKTKKASIQSRK